MRTPGIHGTDEAIQQAVQQELEWTPHVDAAQIGVAVENGSVALSGEVDSYLQRVSATRAALRVSGVITVADELIVNPPFSGVTTDAAIARTIMSAFEWSSDVPGSVRATVHGHAVTLTGSADWDFQCQAASRIARRVEGVTSVCDLVQLTGKPSP